MIKIITKCKFQNRKIQQLKPKNPVDGLNIRTEMTKSKFEGDQ